MSLKAANRALELLEQHSWEETISMLVTHTLKKSRRLFWRGIYGGHLPSGKEAEDIVSLAIEKALSGQRAWDPDANPDLFAYLRSVVDSDLNHLADSDENKLEQSETKLVSEHDCDGGQISIIDITQSEIPGPEEVLLHREEEIRSEKFFWGFYEFLDDLPRLQNIVECIWDDIDKPADIAEKLGVPINVIYNSRKQLQRRLDEYRRKK